MPAQLPAWTQHRKPLPPQGPQLSTHLETSSPRAEGPSSRTWRLTHIPDPRKCQVSHLPVTQEPERAALAAGVMHQNSGGENPPSSRPRPAASKLSPSIFAASSSSQNLPGEGEEGGAGTGLGHEDSLSALLVCKHAFGMTGRKTAAAEGHPLTCSEDSVTWAICVVCMDSLLQSMGSEVRPTWV